MRPMPGQYSHHPCGLGVNVSRRGEVRVAIDRARSQDLSFGAGQQGARAYSCKSGEDFPPRRAAHIRSADGLISLPSSAFRLRARSPEG